MPNAPKKTKSALFEHLKHEVYCHLGISPLHGIGVFAMRAIPKGVNPLKSWLKNREFKFSHDEIKKLPKSVQHHIKLFCYYDKKSVDIPVMGMNTMDMAIYLNHSKKPNLKMKKDGSFVCIKAIKAGEEVTMDYDHSFGETHVFK
jgi:hypothetical protein